MLLSIALLLAHSPTPSCMYVQPPVLPSNSAEYFSRHHCLPEIPESKLSSTPSEFYAPASLKHLLKESAVNNTVLYTVIDEEDVDRKKFRDKFRNMFLQQWKRWTLSELHRGRIIVFTCNAWLRMELSAAGFHIFCDEDFYRVLSSQAGPKSENQMSRPFRMAAVSEVILTAGHASLYIEFAQSMDWGGRDPFLQLQGLDPEGEAFFSPRKFMPGTTKPAWTTKLEEKRVDTKKRLKYIHGRAFDIGEVSDEGDSAEPCCYGKPLPWENVIMFFRATSGALRLVRRMKERTIDVKEGGGGLCETGVTHNLAWVEGCVHARCRTLDPYLFPSEAHIKEGEHTDYYAIVSSNGMANYSRDEL